LGSTHGKKVTRGHTIISYGPEQ